MTNSSPSHPRDDAHTSSQPGPTQGSWTAPHPHHPSRSENPHARALILAGGGAAGNAWELGLVAGLYEAGIDLRQSDLIVGTSAGSTVAAQITTGPPPAELYATILAETPPSPGQTAPPRGLAPSFSGATYMEWSNSIIGSAKDASDMRRTMGAAALEMDTSDGSSHARWRSVVEARLPSPHWPDQLVQITAVNALTGEPTVFDRHSGVDLVDAVAASTSNGFGPFPPYRIGENRYINGAYRRSENADLAAGYGHVLVMSPFGGKTRMPLEWGMDLATQVGELRAAGSHVETVFPDDSAGNVFDANAMDPATRQPAARGGFAQGRALATRLGEVWR